MSTEEITPTTETTVETNTDGVVETTIAQETDSKPIGVAAGKPTPPKDLSKTSTSEKTTLEKIKAAAAAKAPVVKPTGEIVPPVTSEYAPNFKFKVLDQEHEMEEWMRPFVKTKDVEEKFRDLLTKAHGLNKIKTERDALRTEYDNFKTGITKEYAPVVHNYNYLSQLANQGRQNGDWGQFFQAAQIPVEGIIKWAANAVVQLEKNPNYLNEIQTSFKANQNLRNMESENTTLKEQAEYYQAQLQERELAYTLNTPEIKTFAETFDARVGTPGAFRQEVIRRGAMIEMSEKRVASPQEVIGELMKYFGGVPQTPPQLTASQELTPPAGGTPQVQTSSEGKPVLPNVKGRSGSPAKTVVKSTDDLRTMYKQRVGAGA